MKFLKSISLFCFILALMLMVAFFIVFPKMKAHSQNRTNIQMYAKKDTLQKDAVQRNNTEKNNIETNDAQNDPLQKYNTQTYVKEKEGQDLSVSTKQNVTTCDTIYEVEAYVGNLFERYEDELPFTFLGLTREELETEIKRYGLSPAFEDKQKGLQSIELLAFHPDKITVKKVYAVTEEKIVYYLKVIDDRLMVFRSDMEEALMPTDLTIDMLPEEVRQEVIAVKCFNHINEVYDFLESYTS